MLVKIVRVINFINIIIFIPLFKSINKFILLNVGGIEKCITLAIQ